MIVIKTDVFNKHYLTKLEVSNRAKTIFLVLGDLNLRSKDRTPGGYS